MFMIEEKGDEMKEESDEDESEERDYSSLDKYFIDDSKIDRKVPVKVKTIVENVSISVSSFEFGGKEKEIDTQISGRKIEREISSKKDTESRKEFINELEDDSLTLDTCSSVNRDWGKR